MNPKVIQEKGWYLPLSYYQASLKELKAMKFYQNQEVQVAVSS